MQDVLRMVVNFHRIKVMESIFLMILTFLSPENILVTTFQDFFFFFSF